METVIPIPPEKPDSPMPNVLEMTRTDKRTGHNVRKLAASMKKMGLIGVSPMRLKALSELGMEIDPLGLVHAGRAGAMVSQQALIGLLIDLQRMYEAAPDKSKLRLVPHIGYIARTLNQANKGMKDMAMEEEKPVIPTRPSVVQQTLVPVHVVNEINVQQAK